MNRKLLERRAESIMASLKGEVRESVRSYLQPVRIVAKEVYHAATGHDAKEHKVSPPSGGAHLHNDR